MGNYYTNSQYNAMNQDNRQMAAIGLPMSGELEDIRDALATGAIGIQSNAWDVDSLALGGGAFSLNTSGNAGLNFAYFGGRFFNGMTMVSVAAGSVALAASATNYVELDRSGAVYTQTTGWTSGRMPLYQVTTSSTAIIAATSYKPLLSLLGPASVTGTMLSSAAALRSKEQTVALSTITFVAPPVFAPCTGKLTAANLVAASAVATSDANNWTASITNLGAAGVGTQQLLSPSAANSTKATGGSAIVADVPRALTLTTLITGNELNVNLNDVLVVTYTATGTPTAVPQLTLKMDFTFTA
jgi:hypothetical protein